MKIPKLKPEIGEQLRNFNVSLVFLFGSKTEGYSTPLSDIDIGIVFKVPLEEVDTGYVYNRLYDIFSDIFPSQKIDIVFLQSAPVSLQKEAVFNGRLIYKSSDDDEFSFKEYVIKKYADTNYLRQVYYQGILERI